MAQTMTRTAPRPEALSGAGAPSVLAIVVTHRGREWLGKCLASLDSQTYPLLDVLVVDDATPDPRRRPHLKRIAKRHLKRRRWGFLRSRRPLGFGGAINWALSRARTDAELLLFVHDDVTLDRHAVERMVARIMDDAQTAVVGPKIVAWDDPARLEEVGMAADRLGYPYKGLDEAELDLGQHDASREVLYVTSTCLLMRHELFRSLKGWDARMRAYSEDLDICLRTRVMGYSVRVEPAAVARHAIAMARGERETPFEPARYFIRRNRLRTLIKNVSLLRLPLIVFLYFVSAMAETVGFLILRQPSEILNVLRGLAWNLVNLPQTLTERARVQRSRKVPDRRIDRFTVREATRVRAYLGTQTERLEAAWGRRAEVLKRPGLLVAKARERLSGGFGIAVVVGLVGLVLAFRAFLWSEPAAVGELLPYPHRATGMLRAWFSGWRGVGLGQTGSSPPALALLGLVQLAVLGAEGLAQKVLVLGLGAAAFGGAHWMLAGLVERWGRLAAGVAYAVGAIGYAGIRAGALGALVFGAAAPFVLGAMLRLTGWVPDPARRSVQVARVALGAAVSAAFVPGSVLLYALTAILLARMRPSRGAPPGASGLPPIGAGLAIGVLLQFPWLLTWFTPDGPLGTLWGSSWARYAASFDGQGMLSVVLGQTPDVPTLFGFALPLLGAIAVMTALGPRRDASVAMWGLVVLSGLLGSLFAAGWLRPFVASPTELGVLPAAAFAGLVGLAVGAFRIDLPGRGLGRAHAITLGGLALAALLVTAGTLPAIWRGAWAPGRDTRSDVADRVVLVRSLLAGETAQVGQFRALWVGEVWAPPVPSVARPARTYMVTGPRGQVLSDLFERTSGPGDAELRRVVDSVAAGDTDRAGALLGAFNVRYVILHKEEGYFRWLDQRDLAVLRELDEFIVLENLAALPRAGIYAELPAAPKALTDGIEAIGPAAEAEGPALVRQRSTTAYVDPNARGPGIVYLAEEADEGWSAELDGERLERIDAGWANAWEVPRGTGELALHRPAGLIRTIVLATMTIAWLVVAEAATPRRRGSDARRMSARRRKDEDDG